MPDNFCSLDTAHILPVLFPFTTPGKYCYRSMALFCKHVTDAQPGVQTTVDLNFTTSPESVTPLNGIPTLQVPSRVHRSLSLQVQRAASSLKRHTSLWSRPSAQEDSEPAMNSGTTSRQATPRPQDPSDDSVDVAGPRIGGIFEPQAEDVPRAGEAWVYADDWVKIIRHTSERLISRTFAGQIRR